MPLPLPNLDTRRWSDLVDESRAVLPRFAPEWTDYNIHDPGITLIELAAWFTEQMIYRVNRVPDCFRRKFLELAGFEPRPPHSAHVVLEFAASSVVTLPLGLVLAGAGAGLTLPFRLDAAPLRVAPSASIQVIQVFDGLILADRTRALARRTPVPAWGIHPSRRRTRSTPKVSLPSTSVSTHLRLCRPPASFFLRLCRAPAPDTSSRAWLLELARGGWQPSVVTTNRTRSVGLALHSIPGKSAPPAADPPAEPKDLLPPHHAVRTVWDFHDGTAWRALDPQAGQVRDGTRGFTLDGPVIITPPGPMAARSIGTVAAPFFYVRCRLVAGPPDAAPVLVGIAFNAVRAVQASPARGTFAVLPNAPAGPAPTVGKRVKLDLTLDVDGSVQSLVANPAGESPDVLVLDFQPPVNLKPGSLTIALVLAARGTGLPWQQVTLGGAPVALGRAEVWTRETAGWKRWRHRADFDAARGTDADFTFDPTDGVIRFGDGWRGQVVGDGVPIFVAYDTTLGAAGDIAAGASWSLAGADDLLNRALLGADPAAVAAGLERVANRAAAIGGEDEEDLEHAAGRAAEALWAHERLVELCPKPGRSTLDGLPLAAVLARTAPARAATLLDFERLALEMPGTNLGGGPGPRGRPGPGRTLPARRWHRDGDHCPLAAESPAQSRARTNPRGPARALLVPGCWHEARRGRPRVSRGDRNGHGPLPE